jgi:hypothetical protein
MEVSYVSCTTWWILKPTDADQQPLQIFVLKMILLGVTG